MLEVTRLVGDANIKFVSDAKSIKDDILQVSWLTNAPIVCGLCQSGNITLEGHVAKDNKGEEFTYCSYKCQKCNGSATLGEYKKGGMFIKQWKEWVRRQE
jgi:transposase-like protein